MNLDRKGNQGKVKVRCADPEIRHPWLGKNVRGDEGEGVKLCRDKGSKDVVYLIAGGGSFASHLYKCKYETKGKFGGRRAPTGEVDQIAWSWKKTTGNLTEARLE